MIKGFIPSANRPLSSKTFILTTLTNAWVEEYKDGQVEFYRSFNWETLFSHIIDDVNECSDVHSSRFMRILKASLQSYSYNMKDGHGNIFFINYLQA